MLREHTFCFLKINTQRYTFNLFLKTIYTHFYDNMLVYYIIYVDNEYQHKSSQNLNKSHVCVPEMEFDNTFTHVMLPKCSVIALHQALCERPQLLFPHISAYAFETESLSYRKILQYNNFFGEMDINAQVSDKLQISAS